jgi:muramoyltetrapeptide carboxypeptidase
MITPDLLKRGDKIGILAPARKTDRADIDFAAQVFSGWGLKVDLSEHLFSARHSYLSGTDDERLSDLQAMLDDPSIKAIICARGGYGSTRILDRIDFSSLKKHPKWIVGFSDITALHLALVRQGIVSVHGTMPVLFSKADSAPSVESLQRLLLDGYCHIETQPDSSNRTGMGNGIVIGGNLSLLVDSLGTRSEPDTQGKILVLEEIDEYFYKIDRMITQLGRAGKLENLSGLIIGHMTDIKDSQLSFGEQVRDIIYNAVKTYAYPVVFSFPSGHENPNLAWFHGGSASLRATDSGTFLSFKRHIGE